MAHITGGGFINNIPRVLPDGIGVEILRSSWQVPALFQLIQNLGDMPELEMFRVFNMGIGYVLIVPADESERALAHFNAAGEAVVLLGKTVEGAVVTFR